MGKRIKESIGAAYQQMREMFSGATMRSIAGIKDVGEVLWAIVGDDSNDTHKVHAQNHDVWTRFTDVLNGISGMGRLYAPAGILWRLTPKGQGAHVLRARKMGGPGATLLIPDGGDGNSSVVPGWLSTSLSGVSLPEGFEIESTGDQVIIKSNSGGTSGSIVLNKDGSIVITPAAGKTVQIAGNTYSLPQWDAFATVLFTAANTVGVLTPAVSPADAITAINSTIAAFKTLYLAMNTNSNYKSANAKNG